MAKALPNIEKSAFRRGEYVGYAHGVWRIKRAADPRFGVWVAVHRDDPNRTPLAAGTLEGISQKLSGVSS